MLFNSAVFPVFVAVFFALRRSSADLVFFAAFLCAAFLAFRRGLVFTLKKLPAASST
jgi:hypothetical protein